MSFVPVVIEQSSRGERSFDIFSRLLRERIIFLGTEIDDDVANSIVAPAMEYKSEGFIMGVGGKMFTVAGPVLVFGISTSIIVGIIYLIFNTTGITLI